MTVAARVGGCILALLGTTALAAPLLGPYDPNARTGTPFARPSSAHLLGTNDVGHDLLSELIYGARISLLIGIVAALAATLLGLAVGVTAGYARGWLDTILMRLVDVVLALPILPLALVIGVFLGPGLGNQILVITLVIWAPVARELRAQVLSLRERDHIQALRAMGGGAGYVLSRHVVPAVAPLVVPQFVLATKTAILLESSLAFLGLGDVTAKSWGTMLSLAHSRSAFLTDAWLWWVIPPGVAIAATVLAFALVGYAFEERARPTLRDRLPRPRPAAASVVMPVPVAAGNPLTIVDLTVSYGRDRNRVLAANRVSLSVAAGEVLGLVGESGSGKSTVAAAACGLLPAAAVMEGGQVIVCGHDLATLRPHELRGLRGDRMALIPQEAMSALNPVLTVGDQIAEAVAAHRSVRADASRIRAQELLALVGLDPGRSRDYPHQLSGGMRQRVVIAIALANDPDVVIADEPTSGLDVLVQADVLNLLDDLRRRLDLALLVVSHDLPVIERIADRIAVMRAGQLVEVGPREEIVAAPQHPYTRHLLAAAPRLQLPCVTEAKTRTR
ncbi:MAG TPA: dipeptide/oligopeptide/nickel ABC transporter permease/ATP-binding protein [Pseudonocardiaceae bacterium]|nr:dipeptide/oligopeptide/nickel ABC transporter permease/ATP-binding protein [Pseudonocardiaceae bacterium]